MAKLEYSPALDGLRAFSMLAVFGSHGHWAFMPGGDIGVDVFFVLSGFLITRILWTDIETGGRVRFARFYSHRFLRLVPPLASVCAAFVIVCLMIGRSDVIGVNMIPGATYVANLTQPLFNEPIYLAHLWSLASEEQYYLLWAPVIAGIGLAPYRIIVARAFVIAAIVAVVLWRLWLFRHGASVLRLYDGLDTHADPILVGSLLALLSERHLSFAGRFWPIGVASLLFWLGRGRWTHPLLYDGGYTALAGCSATIVAAAVTQPASSLTRFLSVDAFRLLGRWSYGGYLWHYPMRWGVGLLLGIPDQLAMLIAGPAAVTTAALHYAYVERPVFRWRELIGRHTQILLAAAGPSLMVMGLIYFLSRSV